jgi:hypothetical protein
VHRGTLSALKGTSPSVWVKGKAVLIGVLGEPVGTKDEMCGADGRVASILDGDEPAKSDSMKPGGSERHPARVIETSSGPSRNSILEILREREGQPFGDSETVSLVSLRCQRFSCSLQSYWFHRCQDVVLVAESKHSAHGTSYALQREPKGSSLTFPNTPSVFGTTLPT